MEERIYDYWAATLQDGYIGNLINIVNEAGGSHAFYDMSKEQMIEGLGITDRLAGYFEEKKLPRDNIEAAYYTMMEKGISYVNHTDDDYPIRLRDIASKPYGLFVKGSLPDELTPSVAIVGARECSEYGRLMAEYFGDRLAKEGIRIISGMAWGIDGIAQTAAIAAGGKSYAILGCGVDITYPARNKILYKRLCENGNGVISEYAPGTAAESRRFPPRNRLISGLCDALIVVEARAKSGTKITVDLAIDQGRTVMVVPGRLTDKLSTGCLNLLYQGALPATSVEAVLDVLGINRQIKLGDIKGPQTVADDTGIPEEMRAVLDILTIEPKSIDEIARDANMPSNNAMIILTKLEIENLVREVSPGYYIRQLELA